MVPTNCFEILIRAWGERAKGRGMEEIPRFAVMRKQASKFVKKFVFCRRWSPAWAGDLFKKNEWSGGTCTRKGCDRAQRSWECCRPFAAAPGFDSYFLHFFFSPIVADSPIFTHFHSFPPIFPHFHRCSLISTDVHSFSLTFTHFHAFQTFEILIRAWRERREGTEQQGNKMQYHWPDFKDEPFNIFQPKHLFPNSSSRKMIINRNRLRFSVETKFNWIALYTSKKINYLCQNEISFNFISEIRYT